MTLLEVENLQKYFKTPNGMLHAVDGVSLSIEKGHTVGVVGESGCGKSTLGRTMIHLQESTGGKIIYQGEDITHVSSKKLKEIRTKMQIIFQDPYSLLNARMSVKDTVEEPLKLARHLRGAELDEEARRLMELTGIDKRMWLSYPHELDGGRRQRVGIARALAMNPEFIVCDEPVSALDVSIQAQILNLLQDIQEARGLTYMFVTHDMSVVKHIATNICVMYLGKVVEFSETKALFSNPIHPYTKALLSAIPSTDIDHPTQRIILKGKITSPIDPAPECCFAARCNYACDRCRRPQELRKMGNGHMVACCRAEELG
ncbi:MAG: ATP-binding cassette domain-containing protein [Lachnospiraceae bacterium]|nr:ATP-binding cassette domain-containing protein [Lachnospiraceae bacterium]